jgi:hypothetical protein
MVAVVWRQSVRPGAMNGETETVVVEDYYDDMLFHDSL